MFCGTYMWEYFLVCTSWSGLLDHKICIVLMLLAATNCFPKLLCQFTFLPVKYENSIVPQFLQIIDIVGLFSVCIFDERKWHYVVPLLCVLQSPNKVEHLFPVYCPSRSLLWLWPVMIFLCFSSCVQFSIYSAWESFVWMVVVGKYRLWPNLPLFEFWFVTNPVNYLFTLCFSFIICKLEIMTVSYSLCYHEDLLN